VDEPERAVELETDARRGFLGLGLALLGMAGAGAGSEARAAAEDAPGGRIKGLFPQGAPAAAPGYSPGVAAEGKRVVFVSGQGPADLKADMETQIRQTLDRIGLVLKAGGASFRDVVMIRAYFVHIARDLPVYRKVRRDYLSEPYPASTAVGVAGLATLGLDIEIEAVAVVGA
jgi:enamine deaminase RidA (YjgF/YER057c/UK114 family)